MYGKVGLFHGQCLILFTFFLFNKRLQCCTCTVPVSVLVTYCAESESRLDIGHIYSLSRVTGKESIWHPNLKYSHLLRKLCSLIARTSNCAKRWVRINRNIIFIAITQVIKILTKNATSKTSKIIYFLVQFSTGLVRY